MTPIANAAIHPVVMRGPTNPTSTGRLVRPGRRAAGKQQSDAEQRLLGLGSQDGCVLDGLPDRLRLLRLGAMRRRRRGCSPLWGCRWGLFRRRSGRGHGNGRGIGRQRRRDCDARHVGLFQRRAHALGHVRGESKAGAIESFGALVDGLDVFPGVVQQRLSSLTRGPESFLGLRFAFQRADLNDPAVWGLRRRGRFIRAQVCVRRAGACDGKRCRQQQLDGLSRQVPVPLLESPHAYGSGPSQSQVALRRIYNVKSLTPPIEIDDRLQGNRNAPGQDRAKSRLCLGQTVATSIRRGRAAAHGHELVLTKSENEPSGLIETVCELSLVKIHDLSSFRLRRRSQRRDYLLTRHT
jgi:hypothetical protein